MMARGKKCVREDQSRLSSDAWSKQLLETWAWRSLQISAASMSFQCYITHRPPTTSTLGPTGPCIIQVRSRKVLLERRTLFLVNLPPDTTERELVLFCKHSETEEKVIFDFDVKEHQNEDIDKEKDESMNESDDAADEKPKENKEISPWPQPWCLYPRHLGRSSGKQPLQPMLYSSIHLIWRVPWPWPANPELGRLYLRNLLYSLIIMLFTILCARDWLPCVPSPTLRLKCTNMNKQRRNNNRNTVKERRSSTQMVLPLSREEVHMKKRLELCGCGEQMERRRKIETMKRRKRITRVLETTIG